MSAMVFASQKPSDEQIDVFVQQLLEVTATSTQAWVIVDMALLEPGARAALMGLDQRDRIMNAFEATTLAAFGEHAPHLLALPDHDETLRKLLRQLFRWAGNAPSVSWLRSSSTRAELQQIFAYLAKIRIEQRKAPVHCRLADTRVLPELLRVLTPSQRGRVSSVIHKWSWPTRTGTLASWQYDAEAGTARDEQAMLTLTVEQFRQMQHAAEPDGIFLLLCQQTPELVPASGLGEFHARLLDMLAIAETLGVKDLKDKLQFVILCLTCGDDFHNMDALQPTWQAVSRGAHLHLLMKAWDDALWKTLDARTGNMG